MPLFREEGGEVALPLFSILQGVYTMGQGVIPNDWEGEYCRFAFCWPNSPQWLAVARGVLTLPATGRFWDENTGTITEAQAIIKETFDINLHLQEVIMACGDSGLLEVAQAITAVATALGGSTGGGGSPCTCLGDNVQVQTFVTLSSGERWPIFGNTPIPELEPGGFPPGYSSQPEYEIDKCRKANQIVDDFISSLRSMGEKNWVVGVIGAAFIIACLVGVIVVPEAAIPIMMIALSGNIGITALLVALADEVQSNRDEWVCTLYEGDTVIGITDLVSSLLVTGIAAIGATGAIAVAIKTIALLLLNQDVLSLLFTSVAKGNYPNANCNDCGCATFYTGTEEEIVEATEDTVTVTSYPTGGQHDSNVYCFMNPFGTLCGAEVVISGVEATDTIIRCVLYDTDGAVIYDGATVPTLPVTAQAITIQCENAHTLTVEIALV